MEIELDPIHPYILEALQSARAGDPSALAWLESDCISWELIDPNAAILAWREIAKPVRRARQDKNKQTPRIRSRRLFA